jgi:hypothetical protein
MDTLPAPGRRTSTPPRRDTDPHGRRMAVGRRGRRTLVALAATALLLAACGGDDKAAYEDGGWASMPAPAPMPGMAPPDVAYETERAGAPVGSGVAGDRATDGRAVVRNASIELVVDDGAATIEAVTARTAEFGGHVASTGLSRAEDGTVSGSLMLRIPSDRLDEFVDVLDALARSVPYRSIDELDVTLELSDIEAQLVNLRAFETELRELLTEVRQREANVEGLVAVSDRLRQVRTEIDIVEGRRIQLADRVALSTVWVSVVPARSTTPVVGTWDLPGVVRDALAATVRLGQLAVEGAVWFALTVLPALVAALVLVLVVRAVVRRRRRRGSSADRG